MTPQQYRPRGATPLLDALGSLVEKERRAGLGHDEDQIVAVFTDGLENASRRWSRSEAFDVITVRKKDGWTLRVHCRTASWAPCCCEVIRFFPLGEPNHREIEPRGGVW